MPVVAVLARTAPRDVPRGAFRLPRVGREKAWAGDVKDVFKGGNWKKLDKWAAANPLRPSTTLLQRSSEPNIEAHSKFVCRKLHSR